MGSQEYGTFNKTAVPEVPEERKDEFLKRMAKIKKQESKANAVVEEWYVKRGDKFLQKRLKANGNICTKYMFTLKKGKNKDLFALYKDRVKSDDYKPELPAKRGK